MIKSRDIRVLDISLPPDRRSSIMLSYSVKGATQPTIKVAPSSTGGKLIDLLTDLVAKEHNRLNDYHG